MIKLKRVVVTNVGDYLSPTTNTIEFEYEYVPTV